MRTLEQVRAIVDECSYPGFVFLVEPDAGGASCYIQVSCPEGTDTQTGAPMAWKGRKFRTSFHATETEIVQTVWLAVQRALIHEASELFKFDGAAVFDRHISVRALARLAKRGVLDGRPPKPDLFDIPEISEKARNLGFSLTTKNMRINDRIATLWVILHRREEIGADMDRSAAIKTIEAFALHGDFDLSPEAQAAGYTVHQHRALGNRTKWGWSSPTTRGENHYETRTRAIVAGEAAYKAELARAEQLLGSKASST